MTPLDAEILAHRNRIVELKANIHDATEELRREYDILETLEAVAAAQAQPQPPAEAPRPRTPRREGAP